MSMEIGGFLDDTRSGGQFSNDRSGGQSNEKNPYIPQGLGFESTMNITLTAILAQLIGINRSLEDISKTLKEFIVEDDENE